MKKKTSYKTPELRIWEAGEELMQGPVFPVSNAVVDDEAAKGRHDVEIEDKDWGEINNSLW